MDIWSFVWGAVCGGAVSFFTSYLNKKGENRALKEDIEAITRTMKSVESSVNEIAKHREEYGREQRRTIMIFYEASFDLCALLTLRARDHSALKADGGAAIRKLQRRIEKLFAIAGKEAFRLRFYMATNSEVYITINAILRKLIEVRAPFRASFYPLVEALVLYDEARANGHHNEQMDAVIKQMVAQYVASVDPMLSEISNMLDVFERAVAKHLHDGTIQ